MRKPPTTGPTAAVMPLNADHVPMAWPRSDAGNVALISDRLPGTSKAAPTPCRARAAMSGSALADAAQPIEARVNSAVPAMKIRRRPKRSPSAPPTSSSEARNSA